MKNKGFTLVELLGVIVILSLILSVAIPSVEKISVAVKNSQRKNLIGQIEIAAAKYAFDTGETLIFVNKLITEGYLESDEEGNIKDPTNNQRLNCYAVEIEKESDYYRASFIDEESYEIDNKCDDTKLVKDNESLIINMYDEADNEIVDTKNWLRGKVTLVSKKNTEGINCDSDRCKWSSSSGDSLVGSSSIVIDNVIGVLNTKYTFQLTTYEDENIKKYSEDINLKIDNERPSMSEIKITDEFITTNTKKVTLAASDSSGSGIAGYYLAIKNSQVCNVSLSYQNSNEFIVDESGTYLICIKDNVGNIYSSEKTINNIN